MNEELLAPGVPALSEAWIAQRTQHLIDEVSTPSPRRRRRVLLAGVGGGSVAVVAALVGLLGPWATPAFAGWSAQPTVPASNQLSAAEATCAALATNLSSQPGATASATLPPVSLSDARGPYSLLVFGTTNPALCVVGNDLSSLHEDGATIGQGSAARKADGNTVVQQSSGSEQFVTNPSAATPPAPGAAVVDVDNTAVSNGQSFTVVEGSVGSLVSGATLMLSDGSSVVATVSNGLFAAWWPSQTTVSSIQVTTTSGVNS
jgi:hypothetical protein